MSNIPGLMFCPVEPVEGNGINLSSFNGTVFHIPEAHRYGKYRPIQDFEKLSSISEGEFGILYKCRDKQNGKVVTLKHYPKPKDSGSGVPSNILFEISILNTLKHENIINLLGTVAGKSLESLFIVLEYCEFSLSDFIGKGTDPFFNPPMIKNVMMQLFRGLDYIHSGMIIHRDINCSNIYFNENGLLKISGFGNWLLKSSMEVTPSSNCYLYQAPEILLSSKTYSTSADMWSAGCIFGEILLEKPLFSGQSSEEVVQFIFKSLGKPTEETWPGFSELFRVSGGRSKSPHKFFRKTFDGQTANCLDLLEGLLTYYPNGRYSAAECLGHPYFTESPNPSSIEAIAISLVYSKKEL